MLEKISLRRYRRIKKQAKEAEKNEQWGIAAECHRQCAAIMMNIAIACLIFIACLQMLHLVLLLFGLIMGGLP